jgi:type I restriction enzyme S subunit
MSNWPSVPLLAVSEPVSTRNTSQEESNLLSLSYGNVVTKDIQSNDGLLPASFEGYTIVEPGDVVMRLTDMQNDKRSLRTGLVTERGIITSAYLTLRPNHRVDPTFLALVLRALDLSKVFYGVGGGMRQSLTFEDVRRIHIPLPPMPEQRLLASSVMANLGKADRVIECRRHQLHLTRESVSSAAAALLGRDLDGPPLSAVARIVDTEHRTAPTVEGGAYWIAGTGALRDGRIDLEALRETDETSYRDWTGRCVPRAGDVLLSREAPVGQVGLLEDGSPPIAIGQRVVLLRPLDTLDSEYLRLVLMSPVLGMLVFDAVQGSLHPHLNMSDIARLRIPFRTPTDQRRLGTDFTAALDEASRRDRALRRSIHICVEYKHSVLAHSLFGHEAPEVLSA